MSLRRIATLGLGVLALSAAASSVSADDTGWNCRFGLVHSNPTDDYLSGAQTTEVDDSTGIFVGVEFKVTKRFGVEPGIDYVKHDISVAQTGFPTLDFGETTWMALTINGNFHLLPERKFDLYIGPTLGYVFWDELKSSAFATSVPTDDEVAMGANIGIDIPIGDTPWAFGGALRYLATELSIEGGSDIGVDPIQIKAGLTRKF